MRVSLHKHEHIEAPVEREVLLALMLSLPTESESLFLLLNFENDYSGLAVKILLR